MRRTDPRFGFFRTLLQACFSQLAHLLIEQGLHPAGSLDCAILPVADFHDRREAFKKRRMLAQLVNEFVFLCCYRDMFFANSKLRAV